MNKITSIISVIGIAAATLTSCQPWEGLASSGTDFTGNLKCSWDWPEEESVPGAASKDNVVTVLAARSHNLLHYYGEVKRTRKGSELTVTHQEFPVTKEDWKKEVTDASNRFSEGEYDLFTFNSNGAKEFTVDYTPFTSANTAFFDNLRMAMNSYTAAECQTHTAMADYLDVINKAHNGGLSYMAPFSNDIWYSTTKRVKIETNKRTSAKFTEFKKVTQGMNLTVIVNESQSNMVINKVRGIITNGLTTMNIKSFVVEPSATAAHLFTATTDDKYGKTDSIHVNIQLPVFGLTHAIDGTWTGSELKLYFEVNYRNAAGTVEKKEICAEYPLHKVLEKSNSVTVKDDGTYKQRLKSYTRKVPGTLTISPEGIVETGIRGSEDWRELY